MKLADHEKRRMFSRWILDKQLEDDDFTKIIFSDEARFHLFEFVNKQNCRTWSSIILIKFRKEKSIHNGLLCGVHFGQRTWLVLSSLRTRQDKLSQLIITNIWSTIFCGLILKMWISQNCGFSRMVPSATVQQRSLNCCMIVTLHVGVMWIG